MKFLTNLQISSTAVAHIARRNPGLKCLEARGCRNLHQQEKTEGARFSSSCMCSELITELGRTCILEEIAIGWGFAYSSLEVLSSAVTSLRAIAVGLGGSLGEGALKLLPTLCPLLESLILQFQVFLVKWIFKYSFVRLQLWQEYHILSLFICLGWACCCWINAKI